MIEFIERRNQILNETLSTFGLSNKYNFIDITKLKDNDTILQEAVNQEKEKYPIHVVITWTNTTPGKIITAFTHCVYSHVALSLDTTLQKLYSFNMINHASNKLGGFSIESIQSYMEEYKDSTMCVFTIFLDKIKFENLKKNIKWFIDNVEKTTYSFLNLVTYALHLPLQLQTKMVCSQFVDTMLKKIGVDVTNKRSSSVSAATFYNTNSENIYKCYEGKMKDYKPSMLKKQINKIKRTANVFISDEE